MRLRFRFVVLGVLALVVSTGVLAQLIPPPVVTPRTVEVPSFAFSIAAMKQNDRGDLVGTFVAPNNVFGTFTQSAAAGAAPHVIWVSPDAGTLGSPNINAFDANARLGGHYSFLVPSPDGGTTGSFRAALWSMSGDRTDVGGDRTQVMGLSANGTIVMRTVPTTNDPPNLIILGAGDAGSTTLPMRGFGDINDFGDFCYVNETFTPMVSRGGVITPTPTPSGTFSSFACYGINNLGHLMVRWVDGSNQTIYAIWRGADAGFMPVSTGLYNAGFGSLNDADQLLVSGRPTPTGQPIIGLWSNKVTYPLQSLINPDAGIKVIDNIAAGVFTLNNVGQISFSAYRPGPLPNPTFIAIVDTLACRDTNSNGNADDDDDGLCDNWETQGIDFDLNGTIDLTLFGANPQHKDLYVEVDWMEHHQPFSPALAHVIEAFAAAPVMNPDNTTGINLHLEEGEEVVKHIDTMTLEADFDAVKAAGFGTPAERASAATMAAKRLVYRYALFAHRQPDGDYSGIAELPGNDFLITLGAAEPLVDGHNTGTIDDQASTFMHELGHTLGLRHGGSDNITCKPNYLSVMNYLFQFEGAPVIGRPLDYSRAKLNDLDESNLSEPDGVGGPPGSVTAWYDPYIVGIAPYTSAADAPIDWDDDGMATNTSLRADITAGCKAGINVLTGFDDWSHIKLGFRDTTDFADGAHRSATRLDELTYTQALAQSPDSDGDGFKNLADNCPKIANSAQLDADRDGVGNECDVCPTVFNPGQEPSACTLLPDGGLTDDAGTLLDAGAPTDAGTIDGGAADAGDASDGGLDAGAGADGGEAADAGPKGDAGEPVDAGHLDDGGTPVADAGAGGGTGTGGGAAGDTDVSKGCGCGTGGEAAWALIGLLIAVRRRLAAKHQPGGVTPRLLRRVST